MIESMFRNLSRWGAQWQSRLGVLAGKCRPILAWIRVLILWVNGRIMAFFDQEPRIRALAVCAGAGPAAILATGTFTDTGLWFRQGRVCAVCAGGALFLLAPGRRPYVERIPFAQLGESMYNAITGEVLLAPAPDAAVRRLRLDPVDGRRLTKQINTEEGEP